MNDDFLIQSEILKELKEEFGGNYPKAINVDVKDGVATLSGEVESYAAQLSVRRITERVPGVKAVVQEIQVKIPESEMALDDQIAKSVIEAFNDSKAVPPGRIKVIVKDGAVVLDGEVDRYRQREEAESIVSHISAVREVVNNIRITVPISPFDVKEKIIDSWKLMVTHHATHFNVDIRDGKVILSGTVYAWIEIPEAEKAVRDMLGNVEIENNLELTPLLREKEVVR